jgi:hypothetical protein
VARNRRKFSPEFKEEAAKMVVETSQPIAHVARELDVNETTLGNWGVPRTRGGLPEVLRRLNCGAVRKMGNCWLPGVALRGEAPSRLMLRWLKTVVVSD